MSKLDLFQLAWSVLWLLFGPYVLVRLFKPKGSLVNWCLILAVLLAIPYVGEALAFAIGFVYLHEGVMKQAVTHNAWQDAQGTAKAELLRGSKGRQD